MSGGPSTEPSLDLEHLRQAIQEEYTAVARDHEDALEVALKA